MISKFPSLASYRWNHNSCWIDTSLQIVAECVHRDFASYKALFDASGDSPDSISQALFGHFRFRQELLAGKHAALELCSRLDEERDIFRATLLKYGILNDVVSHGSLFVRWKSREQSLLADYEVTGLVGVYAVHIIPRFGVRSYHI